jgi:ankyrin repeat protein
MLTGTPIPDDGLRLLATFPKLDYVNVMLTRITDEGVAETQRLRPSLKIDRSFNVDLGLNITMNEVMATANRDNVRRLTEQFRGDPNGRDFSGVPVIIYAAIQKNTDVFEVLIDKGARVNVADPAGTTPLHWAARYGRVRAVNMLLDRGAAARIADDEGNTALHFAARQQNPEPVRRLRAAGADPSARNKAGQTALDVAWELGHDAIQDALTP